MSVRIFKDVANKLRDMRPGQVEIWTLEDGTQFAIMHKDDFDHVAGLAGLETEPSEAEKA